MAVQYDMMSNNKSVDIDLDNESINRNDFKATAKITANRNVKLTDVQCYDSDSFSNIIPNWDLSIERAVSASSDDISYSSYSTSSPDFSKNFKVDFTPSDAWMSAAFNNANPDYPGIIYIKFSLSTVNGYAKELGGKLTWNAAKTSFTFAWL